MARNCWFPELAFGSGQPLFYSGELFLQPFALGGHIDLLFVEDADIEASGAAGASFLGQRLRHKIDLLDTGQTFDRTSIVFHQFPNAIAGMQLDGNAHFGLDLQFGADIAHAYDQILKYGHLRFRLGVGQQRFRLRERRQRNGRIRRLALIQRVPQLFGDEGHDRRQQP